MFCSQHRAVSPPSFLKSVVNHLTKEEIPWEKRNVLKEAARISRGQIEDLDNLRSQDYDALIFPGGAGISKSLSNFASTEGPHYEVYPGVENVVQSFRNENKPIGLCCISPVIAAKVIPASEITVGSNPEVTARLEAVGTKHVPRGVGEVFIDKTNLLISIPTQHDQSIDKIFTGVERMVNNVLHLTIDKCI
eukprot:TRINITY_DN10862_c0_g2_i6.p1 TRINITY_DN10862_c0_g2~~TRINITY_DN10862_c0_g2_i6.p1  ORF type:complete len:192 (-),score=31.14 TRINITY_DN10862_c0_g2_i6:226-801(-)